MTGLTLGGADGATLGTDSGATLGADITEQVLAAPVQTLAMMQGRTRGTGFTLGNAEGATLGDADGGTLGTGETTTTITGDGDAVTDAPIQTLAFDHPTASLTYGIPSPVQTLAFDTPTPGVSGTGDATVNAPIQTLAFGLPVAWIGFERWQIDDAPVETYIEEVAGFDRLSLTFRTDTATLTNTFRPLKSDEGKVDVLATDDGGFVAVDRADGGNTFELTPPVFRLPLREIGDYHVERYEETVASAGVNEWTVELEFVPTDNRTDSPAINETANADEWLFETHTGDIATSHVDADALGTGADGVERFEVVMRLTFEQAHAWEAAFDKQNATRVRTIPDATNVAVDDTASDENTVTVTPSTTGSEVPQGSYVVDSWESVRLNDAFQEMTVELASTQ